MSKFKKILGLLYILAGTTVYAQRLLPQYTWYDAEKKILKEQYYVLKSNPKIIDSLYISYFNNHKIKAKGYYNNNVREGTWEFNYESGNLRMKGNYLSGMDYGVWYYYYESGAISASGEINKGIKQGNWKTFYENETIKSEGVYVNGKKEGLWKYYNEDGTFKADANLNKDKGIYKEYYSDGTIKSEGELVNGKSNGIWKYYFENKELKAEGLEKDGVREGMWKHYHANGKIASEGVYQNGKKDGNWKYYYESGNISSEGTEKMGQRDGYWKLYYQNGSTKGEGNFSMGNGVYKEFYESGKLKIEGNIKNDKNEGLWNYYYESGALEGKCLFSEGEGQYTGYNEKGKIKMEGPIVNGEKIGTWKLYNEDGSIAGYYRNYSENNQPELTPVYPNLPSKSKPPRDTIDVFQPKARLQRKKSRFFLPKINEFRTVILSANPLGMLVYRLPFAVEYYFQERLGYEIGVIYYREPFFTPYSRIQLEAPYYSGISVYLRQKFYLNDQDIGMFYFGHEIRLINNTHFVNYQDTNSIGSQILKRPFISQYGVEYSILVGNRIMADAKKKGITVDMFMGVGIGYRLSKNSWEVENLYYDELFKNTPIEKFTFPIRFGIMIGYALGKNKNH